MTLTQLKNVHVCMRCKAREDKDCAAPPFPPKPWRQRIKDGFCPLNKHKTGSDVPEGFEGKDYAKDSGGSDGCNCA